MRLGTKVGISCSPGLQVTHCPHLGVPLRLPGIPGLVADVRVQLVMT